MNYFNSRHIRSIISILRFFLEVKKCWRGVFLIFLVLCFLFFYSGEKKKESQSILTDSARSPEIEILHDTTTDDLISTTGKNNFKLPADFPLSKIHLVHVKRIIDGDTLQLDNNNRIRLQGINAPESVKPNWPVEPYGLEASAYVKQRLAQAGYMIRLTYDTEKKDQYGRTLAYVWVDNECLNETLVRRGLARASLQYHFSDSVKKRLRLAQDAARQDKQGIWSEKNSL